MAYERGKSYKSQDIAGFSQYDPGVFKGSGEDYFVDDGSGGYKYAANNSGAFGLGGKTPTNPWDAATAATPAAPAAPATSAAPGSGAQPSTSGIPGAAPAPVAAPPDPRMNGLFDELSKRATQSLAVSPDDPTIKATTDAASVAGQRSLLRNEQAFAERGGPYATGATENNARMGAEALGQNMAGLTATLMTNELQSRRAEIASALSGQFGILSQADQDRFKAEDQALSIRQQDLTREQNQTVNKQSAEQQSWMQAFQEKGFTADQAARLWQEMFNQRAQDIGQSNTVWDQNWKLSGGA